MPLAWSQQPAAQRNEAFLGDDLPSLDDGLANDGGSVRPITAARPYLQIRPGGYVFPNRRPLAGWRAP